MSLATADVSPRLLGVPLPLAVLPVGRVLSGAPLVYASFDQPNSTTALPNAETGQAWTASIGNGSGTVTYGITSGLAYLAATTGSPTERIAYVETGQSDVFVEADVLTLATGQAGLLIRYQDTTNYLWGRINQNNSKIELHQSLAGSRTVPGSYTLATTGSQPYRLAVRAVGTRIQVLFGGVVVISVTNTNFVTATKHGLCTSNTAGASNATWDRYRVWAA